MTIHFVGKDEKEVGRQKYRGVEAIFTARNENDRGRDCLIISSYSEHGGWSGGGEIMRIYHVDGGYVAVHPFTHLPLFCRQEADECVKEVIKRYKGPNWS